MSNDPLARLSAEARARVDDVKDDPHGRLDLRVQFYEKYGFTRSGPAGYGSSELDFMRWEIRRGVLNPLDDTERPGSPWWRAVNEDFLYYGTLADLIQDKGIETSSIPPECAQWLRYFREKSEVAWYRAHNASIARAYFRQIPIASDQEGRPEQIFMNVVLYRVLYAQSMIEGSHGLFHELKKWLADPEMPSVHEMVKVHEFYPVHYPLSEEDIKNVLHKGHSLPERLVIMLDDFFILPHLDRLYTHAGRWNGVERLPALQQERKPIYPRVHEPSTTLVSRLRNWIGGAPKPIPRPPD